MSAFTATVGWRSDWFDIVRADFMRNAFVVGALVAVAAGIVGYFVVVRRDTFAAHALAHVGFPGATAALLVGVPLLLGTSVFCVLGALTIGVLGRDVGRREIATGTVLAGATAVGVLCNALASGSTATLTNVLFGNLLAVSNGQVVASVAYTVVLGAVLAVISRPLLFASVDPDVASARGVPVRTLGTAFTVVLALTVAMSVQVVGTLLLFALIVTPAATALIVTARPVAVVGLAVVMALLAVWCGLVVAAMFDLPPSFPIVAIAVLTWLGVGAAARVRAK